MTQLAFIFGALAGLVCALLGVFVLKRLRPAVPGFMEGYDETHVAAFEQWPTTAFVLDPASQRILAANPAALRNTGYDLDELRALTFGQLFLAEGIEGAELMRRVRESSSRAPIELKQCCKDGSQRNVEGTCYPLTLGNKSVLAVAVHDVTVRRKVESHLLEKHQELDRLAHHDQLTGLPNRLYLQAHLPEAIAEAKKNNSVLAVLFLDLDRFKHVNDSRGHETGDKLPARPQWRQRIALRPCGKSRTWSCAWAVTNSS